MYNGTLKYYRFVMNHPQIIKARLELLGKKFINNQGHIATVIKYANTNLVTIKFNAPYVYTRTVTLDNLRKGKFPNITAPKTKEDCRIVAARLELIGQKFTDNTGYTATVIEYKNAYAVTIIYDKPYENKCVISAGDLRNGNFKNVMAPRIYGVGITGGVSRKNPWYDTWKNMLQRCYGEEYQKTHYTYLKCVVSKEWLYFPNFVNWCEKQKYEELWDLEKDWLYRGNKIYSAKTCMFVPHEINNFLVNSVEKGISGYTGVRVTKNGTFIARINKRGKQCHLGTHLTVESAYLAYVTNKEKYAKELAEQYKNVIPIKLYKVIRKYTVAAYN